jgi:hypothetical protein
LLARAAIPSNAAPLNGGAGKSGISSKIEKTMKKSRLKSEPIPETRLLPSRKLQMRCAWCKALLPFPEPSCFSEDAVVSHGICDLCVGRFFTDFPPVDESPS